MSELRLAATLPTAPFLSILRRFSILLAAALFLLAPVLAQEQDDQYLQAFSLIQQGDTLSNNGQAASALAKYRQARTILVDLQRTFPDWHVQAVAFRLNYLTKRLTAPLAAAAPEARPQPSSEVGGAVVKLLDPGSEPRSVLRLHPSAGARQTLAMTMTMAMDMKMGDLPSQSLKMPGMKMVMDVTVKNVADNGDISYETVMTEADLTEQEGVMPQLADAMKASFAGLKGLSGTGLISNRGISKAADIKAPSSADPQTRQMIDQMKEAFSRTGVPLPEEGVGIGAKWEARMPIKSQGMTLDQLATYELVSIDGERLNAKSTVSQTASNQKIENPSMPGIKVDLTQMTTKATGEVTVDLTQLLPAMATMDSHSDLSMGMDLGGKKQAMDMKLDLNLQIQSK